VLLATGAVFLILIGVNYLSNRYFFKRLYLSTDSHIQLSPKTIGLLHSLTNTVQATVYYDKNEPLYGEIVDLLKEYQAHTRKLSVQTVDYYADPSAAQAIKLKYNLGAATNRDFIIFDCDGRQKFVDGNGLSDYRYDFEDRKDPNDPRLRINQQRMAFSGEEHFSAAILAVSQPKPLKAYFLQGHGEHSPDDDVDANGYGKLAGIFARNYVTNVSIGLLGTNEIPADCSLLVIAGPQTCIETNELRKISRYLDQGGRLFALLDFTSTNVQIGLENILAKWNLRVSHSVVMDPINSVNDTGRVLGVPVVSTHDLMKPIAGKRLEIIMPRPVERIKAPSAADEFQVAQLLFTSTNSILTDNPSGGPHSYPLIAAVERNAAKGIATERGATRMVVAGDSIFLNNQVIDYTVNQDFADSAVNWLLDRTELLQGIGARPVVNYRFTLVQQQVGEVKGILLGAIPGGILLFGGVVWLRRRK
jgi:hypothetical protein